MSNVANSEAIKTVRCVGGEVCLRMASRDKVKPAITAAPARSRLLVDDCVEEGLETETVDDSTTVDEGEWVRVTLVETVSLSELDDDGASDRENDSTSEAVESTVDDAVLSDDADIDVVAFERVEVPVKSSVCDSVLGREWLWLDEVLPDSTFERDIDLVGARAVEGVRLSVGVPFGATGRGVTTAGGTGVGAGVSLLCACIDRYSEDNAETTTVSNPQITKRMVPD